MSVQIPVSMETLAELRILLDIIEPHEHSEGMNECSICDEPILDATTRHLQKLHAKHNNRLTQLKADVVRKAWSLMHDSSTPKWKEQLKALGELGNWEFYWCREDNLWVCHQDGGMFEHFSADTPEAAIQAAYDAIIGNETS